MLASDELEIPFDFNNKTFSLTIGYEDANLFQVVQNELKALFHGILVNIMCAPSVEDDTELLFQGTLLADEAKYTEALAVICGLTKMTPEVVEELQFSMELRDVKVYGDISVVEQFLLTTLVSFTHEARSAILYAYHEASQLSQQVEALSKQVASLEEGALAQKIYHSTYIHPMQEAIKVLAQNAGLEAEDVYPTTFHKVH